MTLRDFCCRITAKLVYPVLPRRARLLFTYWLRVFDGSVEPELRHIESIFRQRNVAIDAGANEGLFSSRLARVFNKVYAFEINEALLGDLIAYNPGNIEIIAVGLSSRAAEATLHIPVLNGLLLTGWASLSRENCPAAQTYITKRVQVEPLDSYSIKDVSFIKIDVEGHELEVLRGAVNTIVSNRPVVLIEIKEQNREQVSSFFRELDYAETSLKRLIGVTGAAENHIFMPRETETKSA